MAQNPTMNFQGYLEDSWRIIKQEPIILILGGFIVQLLTLLSMGILAGPLLGGYLLLIISYLRDNKRPVFNDLFLGLREFGKLFPYFLVLLIILIGFALLVIPGLLFATWWLYVLPLMVDRKMSFGDAMRMSMNRVNEKGFFMHFVFLLLISVVPIMLSNFLSAMIPFLIVLKILLPPFQAGCLASLYLDQFRTAEAAATPAETSSQQDGTARKQAEESGTDRAAADEVPGQKDNGDESPDAAAEDQEDGAGHGKMESN
jgi:hypothetical protein